MAQEAAVSPLATWQTFYTIIGTAAATLTGLMFVAITLVAGLRARAAARGAGIATFSTPSVVHFGAALLVAGLLSAPWPALWQVSLLLGLAGLGGVTYVGLVLRRVRRSAGYRPVLEDWLWHTVLPLTSYAALVAAAVVLPGDPSPALFAIAAGTLLLLFVGIHNAWDNVTYLVLEYAQPGDPPGNQ
jgi:hypothetical protein